MGEPQAEQVMFLAAAQVLRSTGATLGAALVLGKVFILREASRLLRLS